ncbi:MAG: hypothetical protein A3J83_04885 [Elusimicrobia bacterium RIFOXYA2_FULL_40_6]|nr:MAG: hypothetical protein A3J83_04885 [Elusimicrobia bacterium RIFOXYA2_FULL_40_6]
MEDKENLQNVLSELKKVLGDLTKEEKAQVVQKIEKKLGEVNPGLNPLFYPNTNVPVSGPDPKPVPISIPRIMPTTIPKPVVQIPKTEPIIPKSEPVAKPIAIPRIISINPEPKAAGSASFRPIFREPGAAVVPSAQTPSQVPVITQTAQDIAAANVPQIIKSKAEGVVVELPKPAQLPKIQEGSLKFACFFPTGKEDLKETFIANLIDVFKKTSKKPVTPENVLELGVDVFSIEWKDLINKCREKSVKVIFLVHPEGYDPAEIKNKTLGAGIFFYSIPAVHINRKLTYVDLVIELMLHKE